MSRAFGLFLLAFGILATVIGGIGTAIGFMELNRGGAGLLFVFVLIDIVGISALIGAIVTLRRTRPLNTVLNVPASLTGHYPPNVATMHELDGTPYKLLYTPPVKGKNARPSVLTISTAVECDGEFQMVVESWFDKWCKKVGIAVEVQTGDEKFDDECYIRSDTPEFATAYLNDPVKRIAILDLRRFGFKEVRMAKGELSATWVGFDPGTNHRDDLTAEVGARLLLLARNLPAHQPEFANRTGSHRQFWQIALWLFLTAFAASLFSLSRFPPIHTVDLMLRAVPVLLIGWPVFAYVSAWLLSGTSRSHLAWGGLLIGSMLLLPVGSFGMVTLLNGGLDRSAATTHDAVIVEKYTKRSKNKTNYHIRCVSWRDPGDTVSFSVSSSEYQAVVPNQSKLIVVTHEGALGVEWMESKRTVAKPKD